MEKQKVLILGANPETVSLIQKAKDMGLYTIVTDNNPGAYAKKFADQSENINAVDVDALVELAQREKVSGILVGVAERLLSAYCEVCGRLDMPCYSTPDKFDLLSRKDWFKKTCRKYGVPTILEYKREEVQEKDYPVIVKPVDSCSSKGITVCHTAEELDRGIEYALQFSDSKRYLIEKYMQGDEVISYYVMQEGTPIFAGMCDRYTYREKKDRVQLPTAYIFPSRYTKFYMEKTDLSIKNMIQGIGLENGSIFFQCFVDDEKTVRTYEPGYRLNGAQEHLLLSQMTGIDAKELYINLALTGKEADQNLQVLSNPFPKKIACKLSPLVRLGEIGRIEGLEEIRELSDVVSVNPSYEEGDVVEGEGTLKQIVCRFFIVSDTKKQLIDTIQEIQARFKVLDICGNDMLLEPFDTGIIQKLY